jgi:hypothetical protein
MKKRVVIIIAVFVLALVVVVWGNTMTDWDVDMENYGPLNVMENDEEVEKNDFKVTYDVAGDKEIQITESLKIANGNVAVEFYLDDTLILKEEYEAGEYMLDTGNMGCVSGKLKMITYASDDVEGFYTIKVASRQKKYKRWL